MVEEVKKSIQYLEEQAKKIRKNVLEMCIAVGGHIASSFSCVDILVALYHGGILNVDIVCPDKIGRDRFIMSKGHGETALYAVLSDYGFFSYNWTVENYRKGSCKLGGHPDKSIPGVEISTGSLGHGLGFASGMAMAAKMDSRGHCYFVLMGDAECTEGAVWEAALFASANNLSNLVAIVDRNHIGSIDFTEEFTALEPFISKWEAFGWETISCNGHKIEELLKTLRHAQSRNSEKPLVIIAETVKGKGVSFVENKPIWHVKQLTNKKEIQEARKELE
jgi:transketolase